MREVFLLLAVEAPLRVYDQAAVEKSVGNRHGLIEQTAGIVPQIQHQSPDMAMVLLAESIERPGHILAGTILEGGDPNVFVTILELFGLDRLNLDHIASHHDCEKLRAALTMKGQMNRAALWSPHHFDRVGQRHALGKIVIDLDYLVARPNPGVV